MTPAVQRGRFFIFRGIEGLGFINHGYPLSLAQVYTDLTDKNHNNSVFLSKNAKKALFLTALPFLRALLTQNSPEYRG